MLRKILSNYLIILVLSLAGCEEFYNFEANKLDKKAEELIERSEIVSNTDEKIKLLLNALIKIEKIQSRYPKTKVARLYRKKNKINNLNSRIDKLKIISSKQKIQKKKNANINEIRKNIDLADVEFRNSNKLKSSLNLLNAAELSIKQIGDNRTKSRLSNEISKLRILLNDEENAFKNVLSSEKYINEMYSDLPKKIKNLSKVYEILHQLKKENKKKEIEEKIYLIINNEISNNDNKAIALLEIAETNLLLENINKVKIDLKKSSKLAEKSNTYLEIAKISYKIDDIDQCKLFLNKAKIAAKSKDQEFWIIRELINIAIFENTIQLNEKSNETLMDAKKYVLKNLDERIFIELINAFAKINNLDQAKELLNLMKPGYEKAMALSLIGKELAAKKNISVMEYFLNEALKTVPNLVGGKYAHGLPSFSTKGRVFMEVATTYALAENFEKSHKLLGLIESDRFYKEGISEVIIIQSHKDKAGAKKLALKMLEHGGKIIDNKFIGKIAYAQAISGDIENSLNTIKTMELGFDYSQALINIANKISLQQEDLQTSYH
jgi:hypothetical protein